MMTATMTALMWLMMSLMLLGPAAGGITWARRRGRGAARQNRASAGQAADDNPDPSIGHAGPQNPADES